MFKSCTFAELNSIFMLDRIFPLAFEFVAIEKGAIDGCLILEVEFVLMLNVIDGGMILGDGWVIDGYKIGGESSDGGLFKAKVDPFIIYHEVGSLIVHLNIIKARYIKSQMVLANLYDKTLWFIN